MDGEFSDRAVLVALVAALPEDREELDLPREYGGSKISQPRLSPRSTKVSPS